eukprot:TRINITY_DN30798_c0_g1_i1.p1 TRINITY_DN30798_c0_g1~~TRINITY_DN30798_c0_g1_i1.p1  ORF type:complete len:336 (-),score=15.70 TRINITY_DN30798_c0_g1_i1:24-1031(-)
MLGAMTHVLWKIAYSVVAIHCVVRDDAVMASKLYAQHDSAAIDTRGCVPSRAEWGGANQGAQRRNLQHQPSMANTQSGAEGGTTYVYPIPSKTPQNPFAGNAAGQEQTIRMHMPSEIRTALIDEVDEGVLKVEDAKTKMTEYNARLNTMKLGVHSLFGAGGYIDEQRLLRFKQDNYELASSLRSFTRFPLELWQEAQAINAHTAIVPAAFEDYTESVNKQQEELRQLQQLKEKERYVLLNLHKSIRMIHQVKEVPSNAEKETRHQPSGLRADDENKDVCEISRSDANVLGTHLNELLQLKGVRPSAPDLFGLLNAFANSANSLKNRVVPTIQPSY